MQGMSGKNVPEQTGAGILDAQSGSNAYFGVQNHNYDHAEERAMVTPLYPNNTDEVLDWTPAEKDEEVAKWNPNPPIETPLIVNPPCPVVRELATSFSSRNGFPNDR